MLKRVPTYFPASSRALAPRIILDFQASARGMAESLAPSRWQFRLQVSSQPSLLAVEGISVEAAQAKITAALSLRPDKMAMKAQLTFRGLSPD